jgi:hypothetical protein
MTPPSGRRAPSAPAHPASRSDLRSTGHDLLSADWRVVILRDSTVNHACPWLESSKTTGDLTRSRRGIPGDTAASVVGNGSIVSQPQLLASAVRPASPPGIVTKGLRRCSRWRSAARRSSIQQDRQAEGCGDPVMIGAWAGVGRGPPDVAHQRNCDRQGGPSAGMGASQPAGACGPASQRPR